MFDVELADRKRHEKASEYKTKLKFFECRRNNALISFINQFKEKIFAYEVEDIQKLARV